MAISSEIQQRIVDHIKSKGLRVTDQRLAIIEAAFSTTDHYTADQLLTAAKNLDPLVSRATVYRTLPLIVETGLLHELDLGRDQKVYDPNYADHPTHNHLICLDCDKIFEFEDEKLEQKENEISEKLGFKAASKHIRIEANCEKLKQSGTCNKTCEM